jgi:hypothetical protein
MSSCGTEVSNQANSGWGLKGEDTKSDTAETQTVETETLPPADTEPPPRKTDIGDVSPPRSDTTEETVSPDTMPPPEDTRPPRLDVGEDSTAPDTMPPDTRPPDSTDVCSQDVREEYVFAPISIDLKASQTRGEVPLTVDFSATPDIYFNTPCKLQMGPDDYSKSVSWDFSKSSNIGTNPKGENVSTTFQQPGLYTVTVSVTLTWEVNQQAYTSTESESMTIEVM